MDPAQQKCNDGKRHSKTFHPDPVLQACGVRQTVVGQAGDVWGRQPNGDSWDRGHLAPSYALTWSVSANADTFYISNAAPQAKQFNQGGWQMLEEYLSDYSVAENQILFAVAGVAHNTDNPNIHSQGTWIPRYFWTPLAELYNISKVVFCCELELSHAIQRGVCSIHQVTAPRCCFSLLPLPFICVSVRPRVTDNHLEAPNLPRLLAYRH